MKRNKINWRVPKGMEITDLDRKVLYYQDRGHLVPTRELIKTPEQIEGIRRSGIINTGVLDLVEKEIHAGMSTLEIDKLVYDYTISHGGIPATLGYEGFPKSCCTSINEVVCHGIPNEFDILEEGDIINVDCTTSVEHEQLYAQLKAELLSGERSWFNKEEEQTIQRHNALFYKHVPEEEVFRLCFRFATEEDHPQEVLTLSATQLFERMKSAHPSAMRGMTAYSLSRILPQLGERVHTAKGNVYRVVAC